MAKQNKEALVLLNESDKQATVTNSSNKAQLYEVIRLLLACLEEKDSYTYGHSLRVTEYSIALALALGLSSKEIEEVQMVGLLHDIGKIGIPDNILLKPARLTNSEFEIMKSHPSRSAAILNRFPQLQHLVPGIKHHHERYDGLGYPDGLKGEDIPLYGRLVLIADTYDAMTSTRPYRLALDQEISFKELRKFSGTQFDPKLVELFISAMQDEKMLNTVEHSILKDIA